MPKQRSAKMLNLEKLCGGKLKLYQLDNQNNWFARFFAEGKYKTTSLGTENYKIAKDQAISWYEDLRVKQRSGVKLQGSFFGWKSLKSFLYFSVYITTNTTQNNLQILLFHSTENPRGLLHSAKSDPPTAVESKKP